MEESIYSLRSRRLRIAYQNFLDPQIEGQEAYQEINELESVTAFYEGAFSPDTYALQHRLSSSIPRNLLHPSLSKKPSSSASVSAQWHHLLKTKPVAQWL